MSKQATLRIPEFTLGERLRKCREDAGQGVSELAASLNVTRQTVRNWEANRIEPRLSVLRFYAEIANAPVAWLVENPRSSILVTSNRRRNGQRPSKRPIAPGPSPRHPQFAPRTGRGRLGGQGRVA